MGRAFTYAEFFEIEEDSRSALLNEDGALNNPGHHLGLEIDMARYGRYLLDRIQELEARLHG